MLSPDEVAELYKDISRLKKESITPTTLALYKNLDAILARYPKNFYAPVGQTTNPTAEAKYAQQAP